MKLAFLLLPLLLLSSGLSSLQARDWYVDPTTGSDDNDGSQASPLETAQAAIDRASREDHIILLPENAIYRQSIHFRTSETGLILKGNGVTLSGADPIPVDSWEKVDQDTHRVQLPRSPEERQQFIINGTAHSIDSTGSDQSPNPLDIGEFRWEPIDDQSGWLSYRGPLEGLEWSTRQSGLTTDQAPKNFKIFNLHARHFLSDGFCIRGDSKGIQLFGVSASENLGAGFSAQGQSTCWIQNSKFIRNDSGAFDQSSSDSYYSHCLFEGNRRFEVSLEGARHSLTHCLIRPIATSIPLSVDGMMRTSTSLVLKNLHLESPSDAAQTWKAGANTTIFIDPPSFESLSALSLDQHPTSLITKRLYREFPIGRKIDGSPLVAWIGGGTGNQRSNSYRTIHFHKTDPDEIASQISPQNDWFGLSSPIPDIEFPPDPDKTDPETETARAIWTWIGLCAPKSVFLPDTPGGINLGKALQSHHPAGIGSIDIFFSNRDEEGRRNTSVLEKKIESDLPAFEVMNQRLHRSPEALVESLSPHFEEIPLEDQFVGSDTYRLLKREWTEAAMQEATLEKLNEIQTFQSSDTPLLSETIFSHVAFIVIAAAQTGNSEVLNQAIDYLKKVRAQCLRKDGLLCHSSHNDAAWGLGNGLAALGLALTLEYLPEAHPERSALEQHTHDLLAALARHQDHNGMWHQLIDLNDSASAFTTSALIVASIAKGIEAGRLDSTDWEPRMITAWETLKTYISLDGDHFINACPSTESLASLSDYYLLPPITGRDYQANSAALLLAELLAANSADE